MRKKRNDSWSSTGVRMSSWMPCAYWIALLTDFLMSGFSWRCISQVSCEILVMLSTKSVSVFAGHDRFIHIDENFPREAAYCVRKFLFK